MTSGNKKQMRSWGRRLTSLFLMTLALALNTINVQTASAMDPNTPIASDGSTIKSTEGASNLQGENGFSGTGISTRNWRLESAEDFANLVALPDPADNGTESIIGVDSRVLVNPTTTYPARAVVLVTFTGGRCTGWLYGKDIVATAGHCVHSGPGGTWKTNVRVYPGRNGILSPYGVCTAKRLHSVTGWTVSGNEAYDYGAIKLNCTIGNTTGWFGFWWQSASLTGLSTRTNGYPGDKPLTQWRSLDFVRSTGTSQIFYQNDTVGGQSGSPVYQLRATGSAFCTGYCSMAIHAYGLHGSVPHSTNNHGTRINQSVFNNLVAWRNLP